MAKVLVLYYSAHGHIETMAQAVAAGASEEMSQQVAAGTAEADAQGVDIKRVPETVSDEAAAKMKLKIKQDAPVAVVDHLRNYDAIVIGTGTRYGRISSQMATFLDQAGGLWQERALTGKVGAAFSSTGTQHGGQEMTLFSIITNLLHFGMIIVGLPYNYTDQMNVSEIVGGSPYGATTIAGDGSRQPSAIDLGGAHFQGRLVAKTAIKLFG